MSADSLPTSHALDGTMHCILPGSDPTAAPLLIGSHYDRVIDADTIGYQLSYFYRLLQNKTRYRHLAAPLAHLPRPLPTRPHHPLRPSHLRNHSLPSGPLLAFDCLASQIMTWLQNSESDNALEEQLNCCQ